MRPTLKRRFAWLSDEGIVAGALGLSGEGSFDAHALLTLFRKALKTKSVDFITATVTGIERTGNRVGAVLLDNGDRLDAGTIVNAAGPAAGKVAALAGIALPVEPRKRSVFVFEAREKLDDLPLLVDPSGVYVRREGSVYITGGAEAEDTDGPADPGDFDPDWPLFEEAIWPVLATRIPAFEAIKATRAWAGHYDYNTLDQNGVIGRHPEVAKLPVRQRLFRPRPAAGAGRRPGDRRTDRARRLPHHRLLRLRLRAHRGGTGVPGAQCDLRQHLFLLPVRTGRRCPKGG